MCALVTSERATSASRAIFLVYREPLSRRPVSVVSLVEGASL